MSQRRVEEAQVVSHMHVFDDEVVHHDEGQHLTALRSEVSRPGPWRARGKACGLRCDGEDPTLFKRTTHTFCTAAPPPEDPVLHVPVQYKYE